MTNEAGLQFEQQKDFTKTCVEHVKAKQKIWSTYDIPKHLHYEVGYDPERKSVPYYCDIKYEGVGRYWRFHTYGETESEAIENCLKEYLRNWSI